MIIVLGSPDDPRANAVLNQLEAMGKNYALLDTRQYPGMVRITQSVDTPLTGNIRIEGYTIPVADIRAVYYCAHSGFNVLAEDPPEIQQIVYENIDSAMWSFLHSLECPVINPILPANFHSYKAAVLKRLRAADIRVPHTLVTNDPDEVIAFYRRMDKNVVFKPPMGQAFTAKLTENELHPQHLAKLSHSPIMLQEYLPGQEMRAYVVGEHVYGIRVESSQIDINADEGASRVRCEIPDDVAAMCRNVAKVTGLVFTAIDMRLTAAGEYVVLEANSSPDFYADEYHLGFPIAQNLVELLDKGC